MATDDDRHELPRRRGTFAAKVAQPVAADDTPAVPEGTDISRRPRVTIAASQRRLQGSRIERHARDGVEQFLRLAVLEHAAIARQQQGGVAVRRADDERRRAEWCRRLDIEGGRLGKADQQPPADAATTHRTTDADFSTKRRDATARGGGLLEQRAAVGDRRAGASGQLHERRTARRHEQRRGTRQRAPQPHFFGSFCLAPRIFLSMSPRSTESRSPDSAFVHAAIASS